MVASLVQCLPITDKFLIDYKAAFQQTFLEGQSSKKGYLYENISLPMSFKMDIGKETGKITISFGTSFLNFIHSFDKLNIARKLAIQQTR